MMCELKRAEIVPSRACGAGTHGQSSADLINGFLPILLTLLKEIEMDIAKISLCSPNVFNRGMFALMSQLALPYSYDYNVIKLICCLFPYSFNFN